MTNRGVQVARLLLPLCLPFLTSGAAQARLGWDRLPPDVRDIFQHSARQKLDRSHHRLNPDQLLEGRTRALQRSALVDNRPSDRASFLVSQGSALPTARGSVSIDTRNKRLTRECS